MIGLPRSSRGVTLVEMISVTAVVLVLAGIALPVANTMVKRKKELELRRALREIRTAIDRFQADADLGPPPGQFSAVMRGPSGVINTTNEEGYPEKLEQLYEGVDVGRVDGLKIKYLRRLPRDPMTGTREWATRSSRDEPGAMFGSGINIFDVRSKSDKRALDGTRYAEW